MQCSWISQKDLILGFLDDGLGNSSSARCEGTRALALLNPVREFVNQKLGCSSTDFVFTSGDTKGNHYIIQRVNQDANPAFTAKEMKPPMISCAIDGYFRQQGLPQEHRQNFKVSGACRHSSPSEIQSLIAAINPSGFLHMCLSPIAVLQFAQILV
jgi:cysteine sulfinate desulfinase/cysteine desulfurase-like protein